MKLEYRYDFYCDDFDDIKALFHLFDKLGFKDNIVLDVFRTYTTFEKQVEKFSKSIDCRLIKDVSRNDVYCLFIPKLESNLQLLELIESNDIQTEWTYIPDVYDFETYLLNRKQLQRKGIIESNISSFNALFDASGNTTVLNFNLSRTNKSNIEETMKNWEQEFNSIIRNKKSKIIQK